MKTIEQEFLERLQAESAKALRKYGPDAHLPGGHPEKDVHDYAISELVGLVRYAEMIRARTRQMAEGKLIPFDILACGEGLVERLSDTANELALELIAHRRELRAVLGTLGTTEAQG